MRIQEQLQAAPREVVSKVARAASRRDRLNLAEWRVQPVTGGNGQGLGVYRISGVGGVDEETVPWTAIVKVFGNERHTAGHWNDSRREARAYLSGSLPGGEGGIRAPACYGTTARPDGTLWLWLEDVADGVWTLETFVNAAYVLGRWNARSQVPRNALTHEWCSSCWLRDLVESNAIAVERLPVAAEHPLLRLVYPEGNIRRLQRLWSQREPLLSALEDLPQTFAHLDAFRRNLFVQRSDAGEESFTAVDWAFSGWASHGQELVPLLYGSLAFFELPIDQLGKLEARLLGRYLDGLRDAGWRGAERDVQFTLHVAGAFRYSVGTVGQMIALLTNEDMHGGLEELMHHPVHEVAQTWGVLIDHLLNVAEVAGRWRMSGS